MKYSILFSPDTRGDLRLTIRYQMKRFTFSLGYKVDSVKWDRDTQRCKRNTTHGEEKVPASRINTEIQRYESEIIRLADAYKETPTYDQFKEDISSLFRRKEDGISKNKNLFDLYNKYVEEAGKESGWSSSVRYKHNQIWHNLYDFLPSAKIEDINAGMLSKFRDYLITQGYQNETVKKKISMLKWFFRWLVTKGVIKDVSFTTYRTKLKQSNNSVVFLTWDELMKVYSHQFKEGYLSRARDVFCFCCFTSLRYSDVAKLKKSDIQNGIINVITQKTNAALKIELNKYSSSILDKYTKMEGDKALPVASNQKMNNYIKEVCRQCELNEVITSTHYVGDRKITESKPKWKAVGTHCGRRTFICNALMLGIAPSIVMKWTGHSDYRAMKPYIDIADEAKKNAMNLFDKI